MLNPMKSAPDSNVSAPHVARKTVTPIVPLTSHTIRIACSSCNLRELCMPLGLNEEELIRIDGLVANRRKVKRGTSLFRNGEKFTR